MKNKNISLLLLFTILIVLFSCNKKSIVNYPSFLIGSWERINDENGSSTFENWKSDFTGIGYTLKNKDTVFKELLSIVEKNDTLFLKVTGVNENPTLFKFTNQTYTSFTCRNNLNDFPKEINYWIENDTLKANISNEEFDLEFIFKKNH